MTTTMAGDSRSPAVQLDVESQLQYGSYSFLQHHAKALITATLLISTLLLFFTIFTLTRLQRILSRPKPARIPSQSRSQGRGHLLIILGSGGHTAEMLSILDNLGAGYLNSRFARRTWVLSSGDGFSAQRAREFEERMDSSRSSEQRAEADEQSKSKNKSESSIDGKEERLEVEYYIATVRRARRVHQSLLTTPWTALLCLWDCVAVLRGTHHDLLQHSFSSSSSSPTSNNNNQKSRRKVSPYPDLILTNGPATGVVVVLASILLLFVGLAPLPAPSHQEAETGKARAGGGGGGGGGGGRGSMRYIYIESWARVKTLSLSGRILALLNRFGGGRVLVQWRGLLGSSAREMDLTVHNTTSNENKHGKRTQRQGVEYVGPVVG